jgi:hypothetical protein
MGEIIRQGKIVVFVGLIWITSCSVWGVTLESNVISSKKENRQEKKEEKRKDIREQNFIALLRSAKRWHGVKELTGNNDHPMITKAMRLCGLDGDKGYPWCAAAQAEIFDYAGLTAPTSARVVDWFEQNVVWNKSFGKSPRYMDKKGMVGGMYYSKLGRLGHIVLIVGESDKYYYTLEGNTSAWGAIEWDEFDTTQREGDGFYKKIRSKESISALADYCLIGQMFIDEYDNYLQKHLR